MSKDSNLNNDEIDSIAPIDSFVISPNMKHVVTKHTDNLLAMWDVDTMLKRSIKSLEFENDDDPLKVHKIDQMQDQQGIELVLKNHCIKHLQILSNDNEILFNNPSKSTLNILAATLIPPQEFISITSLVPNTFIRQPDLIDKMKLVGYTSEAHDIQVYGVKESYVIRLILKFSQAFQNFIHFINKKDQTGKNLLILSYLIQVLQSFQLITDFWKELLRPKSSPFVSLVDQTFCDSSTSSSSFITNDTRSTFLTISMILGLLLTVHEIRQFIWDPKKYILNTWNLFAKPSTSLMSISNLFLYFKFITYLRALDYFGSNFTIIVDQSYNSNEPIQNDDLNNPWNLVTKYQSVSNGSTRNETAFIQQPDSKSNQFSTYPTSLLAMYLLLTGDSSALGSWTYQEIQIENNRTHFLFVLEQAKILVEIELFFLFPNQRRWQHWFSNLIRTTKIKDIDNNPALYNSPYISDQLKMLAKLNDPKEDLMLETDYENLVNWFKDEIRILLKLDKINDDEHNLKKSDINDET
ncbi:844_t:CDS:2, partial [Funneliformis geosporum]